MPRCKNGTRKNKKTGECEAYTKPVSKQQRETQKSSKADAKAEAKAKAKRMKEQEKMEDYNDRLKQAREEFFDDKQYMYHQKGLLKVEEYDEEELAPKQKKVLASTIKKVEALEKRIIKKYRLEPNEWVGDIERATDGMMENHRLGEFLKPHHERKMGW